MNQERNVLQLLYLLPLLLLFQCAEKQKNVFNNETFPAKKVVVNGKINNTARYESNLFVKVIVDQFETGNPIRVSEPIQSNGAFQIQFPLNRPQDFYFNYGGNLIRLFANPGDTLQLKFKANHFVRNRINSETISIDGNNAEMNVLMLDFFTAFNNQINYKQAVKNKREMQPMIYKNYRLSKMKEELAYLQSFLEQEKVTHPLFESWCKNQITYTAVNDLLTYQSYYTNQHQTDTQGIEMPTNFFDILEEVPVDNYDASMNSAYVYFLDNYRKLNFPFEKSKDTTNCESDLAKVIEKMNQPTQGFAANVFQSQFLNEQLDTSNFDCIQAFADKITVPAFQESIHKKMERIKNSSLAATEVIYMDVDQSINDLIPYLIERHEGKIIYVDFWATWCGPCLKEMSIYNDLRAEFNPKDVAFVYLAINSPVWRWMDKIEELNLVGDHHLLTEEQYAVLDRLIYIEGLPHHIIIDKGGKLVSDKAPRPSEGDGRKMNKDLIKEIHKLLTKEKYDYTRNTTNG